MPEIAENVALYPAYQALVAAVIVQALEDCYKPKAATPKMHQSGARAFLDDPAAEEFCYGWEVNMKNLERLYRGMVKRG